MTGLPFKQRPFSLRPYLWGVSFLFLSLSPVFANNFTFAVPPTSPYAAVTYTTASGSNVLTFNVVAMNGAATLVGFVDPVTIGLYDTATSQIADPSAVFVPASGAMGNPVTNGTAPMTFVAGHLNFSVTLTAGSDSMQVSIYDTTINTGNTYPGSIGVTAGPGYKVRGFFTTYYSQTASGTGAPAAYVPPPGSALTDFLIPNNGVSTLSSFVTIFNTSGPAGSDAFAVTGINQGYAAGGAAPSVRLLFRKSGNAETVPVTYQVIMDYNGTMTDYDNPPGTATVYSGSAPDVNFGAPLIVSNLAYLSGPPPASFAPFMTNGQVVLRVWTSAPVTTVLTMAWANAISPANMSSLNIPYSSSNTQPVTSTMSPATVLGGASSSVTYTIGNGYASPISFLTIQIPPNNPASGTYWNVSVPGSLPGHPGTSMSVVQPSGVNPGKITFNSAGGSPVTVNEVVSFTMTVTASDQTNSWAFPILGAITSGSVSAPTQSNNAVINTEGVPFPPTSFAAAPVSFTGTGGAVSLSWTQAVTNENPLGYVLTRSLTGGLFSGSSTTPGGNVYPNSVTFSVGTTNFLDTTATNLQGYTYSIKTFNSVTESTTASAGPVTAFANPGPPTGLGVLSGGTSLQLNWTLPVSVAGSYASAGYQIYRGTSPGGENTVPFATVGPAVVQYNDPGPLVAGTNYYYYLSTIDSQYSFGPTMGPHDSGPSGESSGFPPGNPPNNLAAVLANSSPPTISASWTAPVSMLNGPPANYQLQILPDGAGGSFVTLGGLSYADSAVTIGHYYVFNVKAIDTAGFLSNAAGPVTGYVGPAAPAALLAVPGPAAITLTWPKVPDITGETIASYNVYQNGVSVANVLTGPVSLTYADSSVVQGNNYNYQVSAVDTIAVEGQKTAPVTSALLPLVPQNFNLAVQQSGVSFNVQLTWNAVVIPSNANVTTYNIRNNPAGNNFAGSSFLSGVPFNYAQPYVNYQALGSAGATVFYWIRGVNPGGTGVTAVAGVQLPPNPPATLAPTSSSTAVTINWTLRPASEVVSAYTVYKATSLVGPYAALVTVGGAANSYSDNVVSSAVTYFYHVTATNPGGVSGGVNFPGGEGLPSANVSMGLAPQIPTGLTATLQNTANDIAVSWTAVTGVDTNASSVSLYTNANSAVTTGATLTQITPANTVAVTQLGNNPDTTYYYWIQTNGPFGSGPLAGPVSQLTYPAPVTLLTVGAVPNGSRALNWSTVGGADVVQYNIYRELQGASSFVSVGFAPAAGLVLPVTVSSPLLPGKTYLYKITAMNATGEGASATTVSFGSAPSSPLSVTAVSGISSAVTQVAISWSDPTTLSEGVTAFTLYRATNNSSVTNFTALTTGITGLSVSDSAVTSTGVYYYVAAAESGDGRESNWTTADAVSVTAFAAPNPPTGATAAAGTGQAFLSWTAPAVVTSYPVSFYDVFRVSGGVTTPANPPSTSAITMTDTGLTNGNNYFYLIQTVDSNGDLSAFSAPSAAIQPAAPPNAPTNLVPGSGNNAMQILWTPSTAGTLPVSYYLVFRNPPGAAAPITTLTAPVSSFVDTNNGLGLTNGSPYSYWLQAVDSTGVTTGIHVSSNSVTVTGIPGVNANPPGTVGAIGSPGAVAVTWTTAFAGAAPVTGYQIWRSVSGGPAALVTTQPGLTYNDAAVTNGLNYGYYVISLSNAPATSVGSVVVSAIPAAAPTVPAGVGVVDGNNQASISWLANAPVNNVPVSEYVVFRGGSAVTTVTGATLSVIDPGPGVNNGSSYNYQVEAVNSNGTTGVLSGIVVSYPYAPFTPTAFTSSAAATQVAFSFSAPGSPTWAPITAYNLIRTTLAGGSPTTFTSASAPITDTTATQGQLYIYTLTATDNKGHISTAAGPVTDGPAIPPPTPANFIVSPGSQQVLVDWSASAPVSGGMPVSEYILSFTGAHSGSVILPATQTSYLDAALADPSTVNYSIQVVDISGILSSPAHASTVLGPVPGTTNAANLNSPTGLTAKATGPTAIKLAWPPPNDQGRIITAFNIYRAGSFLVSGGSLITTLPNPPLAPVTTFTDNNLSPNTAYYYVVRAVYAPGSIESPNSNHAFDTTPALGTIPPPVTLNQLGLDANLFKPLTGPALGIYYVIPTTGMIELDIYNIAGNLIRTLNPGMTTGNIVQSTTWDGKDRNGNVVASGLYLIEIKAPGFHQVKKVAVVK